MGGVGGGRGKGGGVWGDRGTNGDKVSKVDYSLDKNVTLCENYSCGDGVGWGGVGWEVLELVFEI